MRQLISTESGKLSLTKFWSFIGCAVATGIVIYMTYKDKMTWEIFLAYLGTVAGFSQVSKWLAYRYGAKADAITAIEDDTSIVQVKKCPDCITTTTITKSKTIEPIEEPGD